MSHTSHMSFRRYGRSCHLEVGSARDLEDVLQLDEAHWVATSAPVTSLNFDRVFVGLLDPDASGRIVCDEVREAIAWVLASLRDRSGIDSGSAELPLDAINTDEPDGKQIRESAARMLRQLGAARATGITLEQVRQIRSKTESQPVSEAGVTLPEATDDEEIGRFVGDVIATVGGVDHPSGKKGINQEKLDNFLKQARSFLEWHREGVPQSDEETDIMLLGPQTPQAFYLYTSLKTKLDQYYAQCTAMAFDARAAAHFVASDDALRSMDMGDPEAIARMLREAPLAVPGPDRVLQFTSGLNPAYAAQLDRLRTQVIEPLLGGDRTSLPAEAWNSIKKMFAPHEDWSARKSGASVEKLGPEKLESYLEPRFADAVAELIARSAETAVVLDHIRLTEKLILYQAHILELVNNYVSFPYLYDTDSRAMFEIGTLIMDGRRFTFSVKVHDRGEHAKVAKTSDIYLVYATVFTGKDRPDFEIAVPVTCGGKGNLCVGKRGVFEDVHGQQYDARIEQIIENPISLGEALLSPYQRLVKLLSGKIESMTSSAEKRLDTTATQAMGTTDRPGAAGRAGGQVGGLLAGGLLMGGSVAVAALGSAVAYITSTLASVETYKIAVAVLVATLAVVLPTSIVALVKLRGRDLSAILEGAGWAINARMRLTFSQGRFFTHQPPFPKGARGVRRRWVPLALAAVILVEFLVVGCLLSRGLR